MIVPRTSYNYIVTKCPSTWRIIPLSVSSYPNLQAKCSSAIWKGNGIPSKTSNLLKKSDLNKLVAPPAC